MSEKYDIAVIGGDLRQVYMVNAFINRGYQAIIYGLDNDLLNKSAKKAVSLSEALSLSSVIICPIPFTKNKIDITNTAGFSDLTIHDLLNDLRSGSMLFGGNIPQSVVDHCELNDIDYYDLLKQNDLAILNAIATAEGAIVAAIEKSPINLHQSSCLVLGFGRCAKVLAKKLYSLDASVCVGARSKDALAEATACGYYGIALNSIDNMLPQFDFIFNTIPSIILTKSKLEKVSPLVTIIDIASSPGGVDYIAAENYNINASLCPGLPGKYSPKTSGAILVKTIENIIIESSD